MNRPTRWLLTGAVLVLLPLALGGALLLCEIDRVLMREEKLRRAL